MRKIVIILGILLVIGFILSEDNRVDEPIEEVVNIQDAQEEQINIQEEELAFVLPMDEYLITYKGFGEYFEDRFRGYHIGEDVEVRDPEDPNIPVYAIASGSVLHVGGVSGYGGVMLIDHDGVVAIYGHLDVGETELQVGDEVSKGEQIGVLGEGETDETDGERTHLHFALYAGENMKFQGYELDEGEISEWINPTDFFLEAGIDLGQSENISSDELVYEGRDLFPLSFDMPAGWDVEYVPSLEALNIYTKHGGGTARDRSQIFIRYFDAADFLTLDSVNILSTENLVVGTEDYTARRYEIEKKEDVPVFKDQPFWRNDSHLVTDFRGEEGFTRYYVVAANPELSASVYLLFLSRLSIQQ